HIQLTPLSLDMLNQLTAETLSCTLELSYPLSKLVYQKTQGNPFFAIQFLKTLYQENFIVFNDQAGYWQCDIANVQTAAVTDNIAEFM
ncbi:hypothetical protein, partial [Haemophilus parainfluenzae]|uniref:hypothetical protein n=1 Tax=Haemophilus parainfluenzae TaxID=729 RepID=UPI001788D513